MYNFTIPSQLKAWIDRIVVAGTTSNTARRARKDWPATSALSSRSRAAGSMAPARRRRWANIWRLICAGCSALSASQTPNLFPPTASRSGRSTARRRWPAPCKPPPISRRHNKKCDTARRRRTRGADRQCEMLLKRSVPDAGHAQENGDQGYQQANSGKQCDRDKRVAWGCRRRSGDAGICVETRTAFDMSGSQFTRGQKIPGPAGCRGTRTQGSMDLLRIPENTSTS